MGVKELRDEFNLTTGPAARCVKAFLSYKPSGGMEMQVLHFSGFYADGSEFVIQSDLIRPSGDLLTASRETARALLQRKTAS